MVVTENARLLGCLRQPSVAHPALCCLCRKWYAFFKAHNSGPCSLTLSESSGRARESNTALPAIVPPHHSSRSFSIPCLKQRLFSNCLFICPSIFAPPITFNKALPSTRSYTPYTFLYACFQARSMQIPRILTRIHFSLYIISFIGF